MGIGGGYCRTQDVACDGELTPACVYDQPLLYKIAWVGHFMALSANYLRWWLDLGVLYKGRFPNWLPIAKSAPSVFPAMFAVGYILFCATWMGLWDWQRGERSFRVMAGFLFCAGPGLAGFVWGLD